MGMFLDLGVQGPPAQPPIADGVPKRRVRVTLLSFLAIACLVPVPLVAQIGVSVSGRVLDADSDEGVQNARITLEGHGSRLSNSDGLFTFRDVSRGEYELLLDAFGYESLRLLLLVRADTMLTLSLNAAPIELDSIIVESRTIDFDGRVRDPRAPSYVSGANVWSDQGHDETSSLSGRFDLDDVYDGVLLRVLISSFSYLPLDTTFVPDDEARRVFNLVPDPIVARMIEAYTARLDDRAGEWAYEYQPPLGRQDLARFSTNTTLQRAMEAKYPLHIVRRIRCFMLDEREYVFNSDEERVSVLEGTFVGELERIELLEFPGIARLLMARVYTRLYYQRHVGTNQELRTPSMIDTPGGVFCR